MMNLISAEIYKLLRSRAFYVLMIVVFALAALTGIGFLVVPAEFLERAYGGLPVEAGLMPFAVVKHTMQLMVICLGVFAGVQISAEFDNGTIRNPIAVGRRRIDYFIGKLVASFIASFIFVVTTMAVVTVIILLRIDWVTPFDAKYVWDLFKFIIANTFVLLAYSQIFTMLAFLLRNLGGTIGIAVTFTILEGALANVLVNSKKLEDYQFLKEIIPNTMVLRLSDIGSQVLPEGDYWKVFLACVAFIFATGLVSLASFYKRDIK
jgi:ABC-2 type transport system permease protein